MRVIVMPGFHKTGTSSLQAALRANRPVLKPHLRMLMRPRMIALCEAARGYSTRRDALNLAMFQYELAQLAEGWKVDDPRPMLLASEDLAGHMPGRHGLRAYSATPRLMTMLVETLAEVIPTARVEFLFTTRDPDDWLASCHAQHLRASRMTRTAAEYAVQYRGSADLVTIIDRVAETTAHTVHRATLEVSAKQPLGPLTPLIDLLDLPADTRLCLTPASAANPSPDSDMLAALLALNRSTMTETELRAAKKALLEGAR
jgi:sulfotransferase family protein